MYFLLIVYLSQVKDSIAATRKQAIQFKKLNRLDYANRAMIRLKLMSEEVAEAESSSQ